MSPRTQLELADILTVVGLLTITEIATFHTHGWLVWAVQVVYFAALLSRSYVQRRARRYVALTTIAAQERAP